MSFEHEKGHRLFDKLDLEISGCGLYALVGASGSGKSTLFDLLLGLQDPADGRILLNSTEIHEINLKSLTNKSDSCLKTSFSLIAVYTTIFL